MRQSSARHSIRWAALGLVGVALAGCATTARPRTVEGEWSVIAGTRPVGSGEEHPKGEALTSRELGFTLDRPAGDDWAVATNVHSPEGNDIPIVVAHPESGAQIVLQVSDIGDTPQNLATMLRSKLAAEESLELSEPARLENDSGAQASGFEFRVRGEAKGRVAVIDVGDHIVLVVASWPEDADETVVQAIDGVVRSVRQSGGTTPAMLSPEKV
jgi:hypothetical protein